MTSQTPKSDKPTLEEVGLEVLTSVVKNLARAWVKVNDGLSRIPGFTEWQMVAMMENNEDADRPGT